MNVIIYGRDSCKYCKRAKALAEQCRHWLKGFEYTVDYNNGNGWSAADLSHKLGIEVTTVQQIFADGKHLGGFMEFEAYLKNRAARHQIEFI